MIQLVDVQPENREWVNRIRANPPELFHLHYNAHWYGQSCLNDDIWSFLIQHAESEYCGFLAYGQCYQDEYLLEHKVDHVGELYHIVISPTHQRQGIGRAAIELICNDMAAKGFTKLMVAHSPESNTAARFYRSLGFTECGRNYDGDPYLELAIG